jgi:IS605 OrfB family transposase
VFFWRTVRHKGIWLKPKHLMRLFTSEKLHAHTSDACVQAFFAGLKSWQKQLKKLKHQMQDIEHKSTTRLVSTLQRERVQTLVIGDVRDIRQDNDVGSTTHQKLHAMEWEPSTFAKSIEGNLRTPS